MEEAQGPGRLGALVLHMPPMLPPQTSSPCKSRSQGFGRWGV